MLQYEEILFIFPFMVQRITFLAALLISVLLLKL